MASGCGHLTGRLTRGVGGGNDCFDPCFDLARLLVAPFGLFLQRPQHYLIQPHVDLHLLRGRGETADGQLAGEHLVEDHAQGIDVGTVVDLQWVLDLLGGHVLRRAHDLSRAGERQVVRFLAHQLGDAEVGDLHLAAPVEQDVLGLDVSMDDAHVVGILQGVADLRDDGQRLRGRQLAVVQQTAEVYPVDELHEEVVEPVGLAEVVYRHDVRMGEHGHRPRLPGEPFGEGGVPIGPGG